ncbi:hypothetical protein CEXT_46501 [Caerostris extrusa]|uniref:Uncharacterized protein n=1 Tax=Caerostris extrusa TaxID=172846 RepID=A0AAV4MTU0_CAEEX|nr:hypothetical protein CEXT_46501 [Caerostris extrusa]
MEWISGSSKRGDIGISCLLLIPPFFLVGPGMMNEKDCRLGYSRCWTKGMELRFYRVGDYSLKGGCFSRMLCNGLIRRMAWNWKISLQRERILSQVGHSVSEKSNVVEYWGFYC